MKTHENTWGGGLSPAQFTPKSEETFYAVVDNPNFFQQDADLIYQALLEQLKPISFGKHLQRYIYRQAGITQPFDQVPLSDYQDIIAESFENRGVPVSFRPTKARIRAIAKNWLTQQTVSRDAVLLMGFGLRMNLADVEELLIKGLQETRLNRKDPREIVCGYCYAHGLGYYKYESLMDQAQALSEAGMETPSLREDAGSGRHTSLDELQDEQELMAYLASVMNARGEMRPDQEARNQLMLLYRQAQATVVAMEEAAELEAANLENESRGARKSEGGQESRPLKRIRQPQAPERRKDPAEITPADIEQVLQASIPRDVHGNLIPMKKSTLSSSLRGRRFSRQRMEELLMDRTPATRYDLLMLLFFVYSQKKKTESNLQYYRGFLEEGNRILERCGMGPIYTANPFECFLLMCILSEDPLGTYADVMEKSYREATT